MDILTVIQFKERESLMSAAAHKFLGFQNNKFTLWNLFGKENFSVELHDRSFDFLRKRITGDGNLVANTRGCAVEFKRVEV